MQKIWTVILSIILVTSSLLAYESAHAEVLMSYWYPENNVATPNDYTLIYPISGSVDFRGNKILNTAFDKQLDLLDVLAYAFLWVDNNGVVHFNNSYVDFFPEDAFCKANPNICIDSYGKYTPKLGNFDAFATLQNKSSSLKKVISIGGSGSKNSFVNALNHPQQFVNSAAAIVNYFHLAGVDLDFETDGNLTAQQAAQYANLIALLREKLGNNALITMATSANLDFIRSVDQKNWNSVAQNISYVAVMCYDFHTPSNPPFITGYNSNLYLDPNEPQTKDYYHISCDQSINVLNYIGVPAEKIIMGIPAYAIAFGGVAAAQNYGLFQAFDPKLTPTFDSKGPGRLEYKTVLKLLRQGFKEHVTFFNGTVVSGIWAYKPGAKQFLSYDNVDSIKAKATYIKQQHLAGAMLWLLNSDAPPATKQSLLRTLRENL